MRALTIDVGTGTQDILLFDSELVLENCPKLVMPSPTVIVAERIRRASAAGRDLLLTGVTMGGGPSMWAAEEHLRRGGRVYALPDAARTFDDDLSNLERLGITIIERPEAVPGNHLEEIVMRDLHLDVVSETLERFGVSPQIDVLAVAVFDHGAAPPGYSDRVFRFEYLRQQLAHGGGLTAFAHFAEEIPPSLTRLRAVAESAATEARVLVMDTGPAAILGALEDPAVAAHESVIVANIGNFHTLAFHLVRGRIAGLFEHHTGELTREELESYLRKLAAGTISNQEVFDDMGHGALVVERGAPAPTLLAVTGPRRALLDGSSLRPYLAVPHGDMMLAGCFGLLRALADKDPAAAEAVERRLGPPPLRSWQR